MSRPAANIRARRDQQILDLFDRGLPVCRIAACVGRRPEYVSRVLADAGRKPLPRCKRPSKGATT